MDFSKSEVLDLSQKVKQEMSPETKVDLKNELKYPSNEQYDSNHYIRQDVNEDKYVIKNEIPFVMKPELKRELKYDPKLKDILDSRALHDVNSESPYGIKPELRHDHKLKEYPMSITPPQSNYPAIPIPLRYPPPLVTGYTNITDSSDDASDMSSHSPPSVNTVSTTFMMASSVMNTSRSGKPTRPFKAYPKDLLVGTATPDVLLGSYSNDDYLEFRRKMLSQIQSVSNKSNANMKRSISPQHPTSTGDDERSAAYWERRRKNNEAAKRSRDARRAKEDEIAIRAAFLEQENMKLKYEVATLREETAKLRCLVYNR